MAAKIKRGGHRSPYRLRKQVVEPVIGQINQARSFRQFLLRGIDKVRCEWALVCTAHNLLKLARSRCSARVFLLPQARRHYSDRLLGLCLAPPANAGVRSKQGAVHDCMV